MIARNSYRSTQVKQSQFNSTNKTNTNFHLSHLKNNRLLTSNSKRTFSSSSPTTFNSHSSILSSTGVKTPVFNTQKLLSTHQNYNAYKSNSFSNLLRRRYSNASHGFKKPSEWTSSKTELLEKDMFPDIQQYMKDRDSYYKMRAAMKQIRRIEVGPLATLTWENYDMLWMQAHEMVAIETGDPSQYAEEIEAYQSLVPKGHNLVGTLMFEISNREKREKKLKELGHVEDTIFLTFGSHEVQAEPLSSDRTAPDGKTSAIHFMGFNFSPEQKEAFLKHQDGAKVEIRHSKYPHATALSPELMAALREDLSQ
eukprot:gb/GECH01012528.1/.p1 GENE.gb/GECH01012528.1/~~gb/GECH01012528.1/.p1  ORF type:complete len:310 (+),score=55.50 gb/GECH01012528.1/:1-930(+)